MWSKEPPHNWPQLYTLEYTHWIPLASSQQRFVSDHPCPPQCQAAVTTSLQKGRGYGRTKLRLRGQRCSRQLDERWKTRDCSWMDLSHNRWFYGTDWYCKMVPYLVDQQDGSEMFTKMTGLLSQSVQCNPHQDLQAYTGISVHPGPQEILGTWHPWCANAGTVISTEASTQQLYIGHLGVASVLAPWWPPGVSHGDVETQLARGPQLSWAVQVSPEMLSEKGNFPWYQSDDR